MEVTNGIIKWVHSLAQKKNRDNELCFVAEGTKCVLDTLGAFRLRGLFQFLYKQPFNNLSYEIQ